jgi:hypothetical protein
VVFCHPSPSVNFAVSGGHNCFFFADEISFVFSSGLVSDPLILLLASFFVSEGLVCHPLGASFLQIRIVVSGLEQAGIQGETNPAAA